MNGYYSEEELKSFGFKSVGKNVFISKKASIYTPNKISISHDVRIDDFCFLVGDVTIGNFVHLAPYASIHGTGGGTVTLKDFSGLSSYCTIYSGSDDYSGEVMTNPMVDGEFKKEKFSDVVLERHAVVGLHSVILPGAYIAEGCALGAMCMLSKPTDPWGIYTGIQAKRVKERSKNILKLEQEFLEKHGFSDNTREKAKMSEKNDLIVGTSGGIGSHFVREFKDT